MPGQNDLWPWLQSIMQNQGAAQPSSIGGMPRYGTGPGDLGMGDPRGLTANTPGAPSMGYPALGALGAPQPPQAPPPAGADGGFNNPYQAAANAPMVPGQPGAPQPAQPPSQLQDSLTVNPHGDGPPDVMSPAAMYQAQYGGPIAAADAAHAPQPVQGGQRGMPFPQDLGPASRNMPFVGSAANSGQYDPRGYFAPTPPGSPSATPRPADSAKGPLVASGGGGATMKRTPGAPNLGYYQQNPRFTTVQLNPNQRNAPIYTALNLRGGGQQPAVNPNVPAANAQPVSSASPPAAQSNAPSDYGPLQQGSTIWDILSKAPWNYGPLQQGNIWRGSGGPRPAGG